MNITQTNSSIQTSSHSDTNRQNLEEIKDYNFEGYLSFASEEVDLFTGRAGAAEDKREAKNELNEKRRMEDSENIASMAFWNDIKQMKDVEEERHLQNMNNADFTLEKWEISDSHKKSNLSADLETKQAVLKGQTDARIKGVNDEFSQEKANTRKAHLITPTVQKDTGFEKVVNQFVEAMAKNLETTGENTQTTLSGLNLSSETTGLEQQKRSDATVLNQTFQQVNPQNADATKVKGTENKQNQSSLQNRSFTLDNRSMMDQMQQNKAVGKKPVSSDMKFPDTLQVSLKENQDIKPEAQAKATEIKQVEQTNARELAGNIKILLSSGRDEMVVKLAPEHLGKLEIKLKKIGEKLVGELTVENREAKSALESEFVQLKQNMEEQGIRIEEFSILIKEDPSNASSFAFSGDRNNQQMPTRSPSENQAPLNEVAPESGATINSGGLTSSGLNIFA